MTMWKVIEGGLFAAALVLLICCGGPAASTEEAREKPAAPPPMPADYRVRLDTSKGEIVIEVHKEWAPQGAERFYDLINGGFFDGARFYRVVRNYIVQFGFNGDPSVDSLWQASFLKDDPRKQSNRKGYVSFAQDRPNSRTTQVFINLRNNVDLDKAGFVPFGEVIEGMDAVESLYSSYGDLPPRGYGPDPAFLGSQGNAYLKAKFPRLDFIRKAIVVSEDQAEVPKDPK